MLRIRPFITSLATVAAVVAASACDDPFSGFLDPQLVEDTVEIAAPTGNRTDLPSAIDVSAGIGSIGGGRNPESSQDHQRWDLTLRERETGLVLVPAAAVGLDSQAGMSVPEEDTPFDELPDAPRSGYETEEEQPASSGAVYYVRSRSLQGCGPGQFAKLQVLETDASEARAVLRVVVNGRCGDQRLTD